MHHFYIYEVVITQKWGLEIERKTTSAVEAFRLPTKKGMRISYVCGSSGCYCWCCESLGVQMGNGNATLWLAICDETSSEYFLQIPSTIT
jgi:hypothetical protein